MIIRGHASSSHPLAAVREMDEKIGRLVVGAGRWVYLCCHQLYSSRFVQVPKPRTVDFSQLDLGRLLSDGVFVTKESVYRFFGLYTGNAR